MDTKFRRLSEDDVEEFEPFRFFKGLVVAVAISLLLWAGIVAVFVW